MEYVEGACFADLPALCGGRLPPAAACRLMAEVCRGLHAAHELTDLSGAPLHVVHRDISPQNLMLTFDGKVKILDFGIARSSLREAPLTAVGNVRGKPGYMAPEQLTAGDIDRRTDVFLAGVVLHELLTGRRLFAADNFMAVAHALMTQPIQPPSRSAEVDQAIDALVLKSLARAPSERFPTAAAMAESLEHAARVDIDVPIKAAREQWLQVFERRYLAAAFEACGKNLTRTAERIRIGRRHLRALLRKYGLADGE